MPKRIYDIAKERGLQSQQVLRRFRLAGVDVKTANSVVQDADIEKVFGKSQAGKSVWSFAQTGPRTVKKADIQKETDERNEQRQKNNDLKKRAQEQARQLREQKLAHEQAQKQAGSKQAQAQLQAREALNPADKVAPEALATTTPQHEAAPKAPTELEKRRFAQEKARERVGDLANKRRADLERERLEEIERQKVKTEKAKVEKVKPEGSRSVSYHPSDKKSSSRGGRRRVVIDSRAGHRRGSGRKTDTKKTPFKKIPAQAIEVGPTEVISGVTVQELAQKLVIGSTEIIRVLMGVGEMVTVTQSLSQEQIELLGLALEKEIIIQEPQSEIPVFEDVDADMTTRAPIVTVMGHVDHGKTTLLDNIRNTQIAQGESGGITQHIGAYQTRLPDGRSVTFIDTPGHEAFTSLRARGAKVTDVAVLVVAADDGVRPQTEEAVAHAKAAGVPIVVAINKIDKDNANIDRVKTELAEKFNLVPEEWGGQTIMVAVSAKKGENLDELIEMLALQADILELKANQTAPASGYVLESHLDVGRGPVATFLVNRGTLRVGDVVLAGDTYGRVRALYDYTGKRIQSAGPSVPVEIVGLGAVAQAGAFAQVLTSEKQARAKAHQAHALRRRAEMSKAPNKHDLASFFAQEKKDEKKLLNLIIKADAEGSLAAIEKELSQLGDDEVGVQILHQGVGHVSKTDVDLANASGAVILGFGVKSNEQAQKIAEKEHVQIQLYNIIYQLKAEIEAALTGMLAPEFYEEVSGHAQVRLVFTSSRTGKIAGCMVTDGYVDHKEKVRLLRQGEIVFEGKINSIQRGKEQAARVEAGFECGIVLDGFDDIAEGDVIETYVVLERARILKPA